MYGKDHPTTDYVKQQQQQHQAPITKKKLENVDWISYLHFDWANIVHSLSFTSLRFCECVFSLFFPFFFVFDEND